ncbi:putative TPR domain protein [Algoriphagus machipongonensis]|uniref:TPR domain protein n=1 Tax=Algoriphagus machipongonensis TaxID=388413 RepID=A3HZY1_9BACT|nr:putative TPR domain protein [Algoriphagus machipongonensis]
MIPGSCKVKRSEMQEVRSDIEYKLGNFDLVIEHLDKAIELMPTNSRLYFKKANCLISLKKFQKALKVINQSIELGEPTDLHYLKKAEIFLELDQKDSSFFYYDFSIRISKKPERVYESRAKSNFKLGFIDFALSDINKAIQINPGYIEGYNTRGEIYYDSSEYEKAIPDFSYVIENSIDDKVLTGSAFVHRGGSYLKTGKLKLACEDWKMAVELGMNQATVLIDDFCN